MFNFIGFGKSNSYVTVKEIDVIRMGLQEVLEDGIKNGVGALINLHMALAGYLEYWFWQHPALESTIIATCNFW